MLEMFLIVMVAAANVQPCDEVISRRNPNLQCVDLSGQVTTINKYDQDKFAAGGSNSKFFLKHAPMPK